MMRRCLTVTGIMLHWPVSSGGAIAMSLFALYAVAFPTVMLIWGKTDMVVAFTWMLFYVPAGLMAGLKRLVLIGRERRWPRSRSSHLIVLGGLTAMVVFGLPLLTTAYSDPPVLGRAAWLTTGMTLVSWWAVRPSLTTTLLGLTAVLAPLTSAMGLPLRELLDGSHETLAMAMLAASALGFLAALGWLACLSEENPYYHSNLNWGGGRRDETGLIAERWRSSGAEWFAWFNDPSRDCASRWRRWAEGTTWQRAKLWGDGLWNASTGLVVVIGLFQFGLFALMGIGPGGGHQAGRMWPLLAIWLSMMPVVMVLGVLQKTSRLLAGGWLRPVDRVTWVREVGLCASQKTAGAWLGVLAAFLLVTMIEAAARGKTVPWAELACVVAACAAVTVLIFGLGVWTARWSLGVRHTFILVLLSMVFGFLSVATVLLTIFMRDMPTALGACLLLIAVLGCLVIHDAGRRWMQVELGRC